MVSGDLDTILKIVELVSVIGGGAIIMVRLGRTVERFEQITETQGREIKDLKHEVKNFADLITAIAVQQNQLDNLSQRITILDQRYEELRHGEGYVYPLQFPKPG